MLTGEPEYLNPLGDETPDGWIVTGYPVDQFDRPLRNKELRSTAYKRKIQRGCRRCGSVVGYALMQTQSSAGIKQTGLN